MTDTKHNLLEMIKLMDYNKPICISKLSKKIALAKILKQIETFKLTKNVLILQRSRTTKSMTDTLSNMQQCISRTEQE